MCTALNFKSGYHYFGRNLDWENSYGERVVITPQNFPIYFREETPLLNHFAIMGMGIVSENYPLYFDAVNEKGLCVAGLNFPGNAVYNVPIDGKYNVAPFEVILWILSQCKTADEAKMLMSRANIIDIRFNRKYGLTPMHWIVSDSNKSVVFEPTYNGLMVYDNPTGVLTNSPEFPMQMHNLNNYMSLSPTDPQNTFSPELQLEKYSRGMGALGLPGDYSSESRFVRGVYVSHNAVECEGEEESVNQFFHILSSVEMPKGCIVTENGYEHTIYSSCINADKRIYYYTTYESNRIYKAELEKYDINTDKLTVAEV